MKTLIVYDTVWGNTEKVARAIGNALPGEVKVIRAMETDAGNLKQYDLVFIGSPTQGGRPLKSIQDFLARIPARGLDNVQTAAFDTRTKVGGLARVLVNMLGYAGPRIGKEIKAKGGDLVTAPEGFLVHDKEGPVLPGELERAAEWAQSIIGSGAGISK